MTQEFVKGLKGVVAANTTLSEVRALQGLVHYRGYNINEVAQNATFEETMHLLWYGEFPTVDELSAIKEKLGQARGVPEMVKDFIRSNAKEARGMDLLRTCVSMLGVADSKEVEMNDKEGLMRQVFSIAANMSVLVALIHRARQGQSFPEVRRDLSEAEHFLYMLTGQEPDPEAAKTLDLLYVLHAEHGFNASTFASRVTIATRSDIYSAITSALGTLKGSVHGGANERTMRMLLEIGEESNTEQYVYDKLSKRQRIMGIGHPVYRVMDPRAILLKEMAIELTAKSGKQNLVNICDKIAAIMKEEKGLYPNVDFYASISYYSLGIPIDLFTPMFSVSRSVGWAAHVLEQIEDDVVIRPKERYIGVPEGRKVIPIEKRIGVPQ